MGRCCGQTVRVQEKLKFAKVTLPSSFRVFVCSEFDVQLFEAKNRVFQFNFQTMNTIEFIRSSKKLCLSSV